MRFDIVLNDLCALAWTTKKIVMVSDGSPWRPVVHIEDIIEAVRCTLEAPGDTVNGEIFNVGATTRKLSNPADRRHCRPSLSGLVKSPPGHRAMTIAVTA